MVSTWKSVQLYKVKTEEQNEILKIDLCTLKVDITKKIASNFEIRNHFCQQFLK